MDMTELAFKMRELADRKASLEEQLSDLNKEYDVLRLRTLPDFMAENDIRTATIDGAGRVQLATDLYATIIDKEAGYAWLNANGYDGLIAPYIHPSTFKAAAKEALKNGAEWPEELFKLEPFVRASIVKVSTK